MQSNWPKAVFTVLGTVTLLHVGSACADDRQETTPTAVVNDMGTNQDEQTVEESEKISERDSPISLGQKLDTDGWAELSFVALGRFDTVVAEELLYPFDPGLVYVAFHVVGESKDERRTNLYETLMACESSGSVGASGVFREALTTWDIISIGGIERTHVDNNEVEKGVRDSKFIVYAFDPKDSDLRINSQTKVCGEFDVWIDVGSLSFIPVIDVGNFVLRQSR